MDDDKLVALILSIVFAVLIAAFITFQIVWIKRFRKKYLYRWQSHEIVFESAARSVRLYVDGNLEDEFGARDVRVCTLRAFVEGTEIKARMTIRAMKVQIEVTAGNTPLQPIGIEK